MAPEAYVLRCTVSPTLFLPSKLHVLRRYIRTVVDNFVLLTDGQSDSPSECAVLLR